MLDTLKDVGQPLDPANKNLTAWFERMKARPSAAA
jgi:glutathione S-transferase